MEFNMAGLNMTGAFNSAMLSKMTRYTLSGGHYDDQNNWVEGYKIPSTIWGVVKSGNKFSQFDEGEALLTEDGGARFSNYKTLFVTDKFPVELGDKILYLGEYYNVNQRSNEIAYNFRSYLIEKSEEWTA